MKKVNLFGAVTAAFVAGASFGAPSMAAGVSVNTVSPLTTCVSVLASNGCLFDGNIAPSTFAETESDYNLFNNSHPTANPDIDLTYLFKSDDGAGFFGSLTGAGMTSGTWSTPGYLVNFVAVKASNAFVLYQLATPASSGSWDSFDIPYLNKKGKGNPHALSHLTFFGTLDSGGSGGGNAIPEPGAWALMILGFGAAGTMLRRRRALLA